jgi:hypothetical protein
MKRLGITLLRPSLLLAFTMAVSTGATVINFEAEAANTGGSLTGIPNLPFTIDGATFTDGELRGGELGLNADTTGVYASDGLFGSGETNPLVIRFAAPVENLSILVLNGDDARNYTVSDNIGESLTNSLASAGGLGAATFSLPGNEITTLTINSANADAWDFAIDNVTFTVAAPTPEPEPLLLGFGLTVLATAASRKWFRGWRRR